MTSRLRNPLPWIALSCLGLGAVIALLVLPAMRADARGAVFAHLRALQVSGAPLARTDLVSPVAGDEEAARALIRLLQKDNLHPSRWEPPADSPIAPDAFHDLVENRIFAEDLDEQERAIVARWIDECRPDLDAVRGKVFGDLTALDGTLAELPHSAGISRILAAEAVLAAYDGHTPEVLAALTDALGLACIHDANPLAITFLGWVYATSFSLAAARRALDLLPDGADLAPFLAHLDAVDIDARLHTAFLGERVFTLEALGLVRDGRPTPEEEFVFRRRSPWQPLSWPPFAEWSVLDDLGALALLIESGTTTQHPRFPERMSSAMQSLVHMDLAESARALAAQVDELRAHLAETTALR